MIRVKAVRIMTKTTKLISLRRRKFVSLLRRRKFMSLLRRHKFVSLLRRH